MGTNGHKRDGRRGTTLFAMTEGGLPMGAGSPGVEWLLELCRRRSEQGVDTSQIERFIEEGIAAYAEGKALYAEVMLRIAQDSLE